MRSLCISSTAAGSTPGGGSSGCCGANDAAHSRNFFASGVVATTPCEQSDQFIPPSSLR